MGNNFKETKLIPTPAPSLIREGTTHVDVLDNSCQYLSCNLKSTTQSHNYNFNSRRTYRPNVLSSYRLKNKLSSLFTFHPSLKPKAAFALAEVLITLGIIGVVAALTMPVLIANHRKTEAVTRLKKVYTTINQAVYMSIANDTWTEPPLNDRYNQDALNEWMNKALYPYLNDVKKFGPGEFEHPSGGGSTAYGLMFSDGTIMWFSNNYRIHVYVDTNGLRGPNKGGVDCFRFFLDYENERKLGYFYPSGYTYSNDNVEDADKKDQYVYGNRDGILKYCKSEYVSGNFAFENTCGLLIMYEGWQIPEDYPVNF